MFLHRHHALALFIAFAATNQALAQPPAIIRTQSEVDLIPEGIALDPATGTLYISSIARQKIISVHKDGTLRDFITQGEGGYLEGLGMKVDSKRNLLWTLSNKTEGKLTTSRILGFDLKTRQKKWEHTITDTMPRLLNDLVINAGGDLYITDTEGHGILHWRPGSRNHKWLVKTKTPLWPNGLTIGRNERIYLASYARGLRYIDPKKGRLLPLNGYADTAIAHGLDGLLYWNNTLVGVYNVGKTDRHNVIIQYYLNPAGDTIVREVVLDRGNLEFHDPTTAVITGNSLYVLANSYLDPFNANRQSTEGIKEKLGPVVVLKYELRR